MGKFINTERKDTMSNVIDGFKERLKNPYYLHNDKSATIVDYYSINRDKSTLDDGLKLEYGQIIGNSPFRYNLIRDFYLYGGLEQLPLQLNNSENGLSSDSLNGSSIILPNTIVPSPGDHFKLQYLNKPYLFEVISVNVDTIESGANLYQIEFEYSEKDDIAINKLVVEEYNMIVDNNGTSLKNIIKKDSYNFISILEEVTIKLKQYYKYLFYRSRVETFILSKDNDNFYDPYLIEFIIRNKILEGDDEYVLVDQQMSLPRTFGIDYDNSIFRAIESKSINRFNNKVYGHGTYIDQPLSLLSMNKEEYFWIDHVRDSDRTLNPKFKLIDEDLIDRIRKNNPYYIRGDLGISKFKGKIKYVSDNGMIPGKDLNIKGSIFISNGIKDKYYNGVIENNTDNINTDKFKGIITNIPKLNISNYKGSISIPRDYNNSSNILSFKSILRVTDRSGRICRQNNFKGSLTVNNQYITSINKINNIIIKYFNNRDITIEDINNLEDLNYIEATPLFYNIPIIIFILEKYILSQLEVK